MEYVREGKQRNMKGGKKEGREGGRKKIFHNDQGEWGG